MTAGNPFHWLDPRRSHPRLLWAVAMGVIVWLVLPSSLSSVARGLIAGDVGGLTLLGLVARFVVRSNSDETRRRAAARDPGHTLVWIMVATVSSVSLFAAAFVMRHAKAVPSEARLLSVLAVATAAISWLIAHAGFALRYAHLYYRGKTEDEGGITFCGGDKPDDLDFVYFAFTIGMCFQVSDATIDSRSIRHTALVHAILSFAFNTGILALVLNIVMTALG